MKFAVDKIENDIVVLENLSDNSIIEVPLILIPNVKEKDIIMYENNTFKFDLEEKEKRELTIKERMAKLKAKDEKNERNSTQ